MTEPLSPAVPIRDTPELRKLLRQRCPQDEIVRLATGGWFELVNVQNMRRRWISFLARGVRSEVRGQAFCYCLYFEPTTGKPIKADLLYLWDEQDK